MAKLDPEIVDEVPWADEITSYDEDHFITCPLPPLLLFTVLALLSGARSCRDIFTFLSGDRGGPSMLAGFRFGRITLCPAAT